MAQVPAFHPIKVEVSGPSSHKTKRVSGSRVQSSLHHHHPRKLRVPGPS